MKIPRDLSEAELAKRLRRFGYAVTRQTGSHLRLTRGGPPQHHITMPRHTALRVGTLRVILHDVAAQLGTSLEHLVEELA